MDKGEIIETGTHDELIQSKGKYFDLWKDQLPGHMLYSDQPIMEVAAAQGGEIS